MSLTAVESWGAAVPFRLSEQSVSDIADIWESFLLVENQGVITKSRNYLICLNIVRTRHSLWH